MRFAVVLVGAYACLVTVGVSANEPVSVDPFDLTRAKAMLAEGIPTVEEVNGLEETAKKSFESGNCKAAVDDLDLYAKKANHLANLIVAGLEPFYGASYDDRKAFRDVRSLIPLENLANDYKDKRNRAMVMRAECLFELGQTEEGIGVMVVALDLISIDDQEWWMRARKGLYDAIGVDESAN